MTNIFKEKADEYKAEFGENACRVVELLIEEYDEDHKSARV